MQINDIICPACGCKVQPGPYCPVCKHELDQPEQKNSAAVSGEVIAVSGNIDNSSRSTVDSHDVHQTTYNNVTLSAEAEREKRYAAYRAFCEPLITNGLISKSDRTRLVAKAQQLSISPSEALEIEEAALKSASYAKVLTSLQSEMLDEDINSLLAQRIQAAELSRSLKVYVDEGYEDEKVLYYYYFALALANPSQLTNTYQQQRGRYFCYWQCYWACIAYIKTWKPTEAKQLCALLAGYDDKSAHNSDNLRLAQLFLSVAESIRTGAELDRTLLSDKLNKIHNFDPLLLPLHSVLEYTILYYANGKIPTTDDKTVTLMLSLLPNKIETAKPKPAPIQNHTQAAPAIAQQTFSTTSTPTQVSTSAPTPISDNDKKGGKGLIAAVVIAAVVVLFFIFRTSDEKIDEPSDVQTAIEETTIPKKTKETKKETVKTDKPAKSVTDTRPARKDEATSTAKPEQKRQVSQPASQTISDDNKNSVQEDVNEVKSEPTTPKALIRMADKLVSNTGTRHQAIEYYKQAAEKGNAEAMVKLGKAYDMAGPTQDKGKAKLWLEKARDSDDEISSATARSYLLKHSF